MIDCSTLPLVLGNWSRSESSNMYKHCSGGYGGAVHTDYISFGVWRPAGCAVGKIELDSNEEVIELFTSCNSMNEICSRIKK